MELYEHQKRVLRETKDFNKVAFYLDMGLGKTFTGAEKMVKLNADTNILICQKSKIQDWIEHFKTHYPNINIHDLTKRKELDEFISHDVAWAGWHGCTMTVGVINYELAWRRKELLKLKNFTLLLDESSLIQNKTAKQTKFILKLNPANVILLSGTPTAGKYENLWTQAKLIGWDIKEKLFLQHYVNFRTIKVGDNFHKTVNKENPYKNEERLKNKLREHGAVFMKTDEVMDLPEQNFIEVKVSKSKKYKIFMKDSIVTVDDVELVGDTTLTKRLYARQLCGQYNIEKHQAFRDLIESTNDRIIVFYNFTEEMMKLLKICDEVGKHASVINGKMKCLDAYENESDSITFVQYQAGSMGLNLQKANKIIYFSPPERCELWMQSQKRIHRIGQERPCFYYKLIVSESIEGQIYKALERGVDFTDELFKEGK